MTPITPVILCGGSGTRLWPLSRRSYPKQFAALAGDVTLFQATAQRLRSTGASLRFAPPVVLTGADFRFIVTEQLVSVGIDPGAVVIEPEARNTAPAVLVAALLQLTRDPDAVLLIAPSDHVMPDTKRFVQAVEEGLLAVDQGKIVTFGIRPKHPHTGYGYLHLEVGSGVSGGPANLRGFLEKPALAQAERMVADGNYLWNAGIFLARTRDIVAAFHVHAPDMIAPVQAALDNARVDLGFLRLDPVAWRGVRDVSLDYAIMERADNLAVVPFEGDWSDLGGWDAVWTQTAHDADEVATKGLATAIECRDTLLWSESDRLELVGIGLDNLVVVAMSDAVLVADKSRAQDVGRAVSALKARNARQATTFPKDHRPWGWFESLVVGGRFQVKRIHVFPGAALSLQSHFHRSEHWVVVEGTARVTLNGVERLVSENESVYIPIGAKHRLENPGKMPMSLIEVQTGPYVGEDDIIRYEDLYARDSAE